MFATAGRGFPSSPDIGRRPLSPFACWHAAVLDGQAPHRSMPHPTRLYPASNRRRVPQPSLRKRRLQRAKSLPKAGSSDGRPLGWIERLRSDLRSMHFATIRFSRCNPNRTVRLFVRKRSPGSSATRIGVDAGKWRVPTTGSKISRRATSGQRDRDGNCAALLAAAAPATAPARGGHQKGGPRFGQTAETNC